MLFYFGLALLFFLPIVESFDRTLAFNLLLIGSLLIAYPYIIKKRIYLDWINIIWITTLIFFTLSLFNSWSISRTFIELSRYFAYFLIFISLRNYPSSQLLLLRFYLPMIIVNSLILSFLSFLYFIPLFNIPRPASGMNLFYPTFGYNRLAILLIFAIPLSFSIISHAKNKLKLIGWIISIFFIVALVLSMGRGVMLSLFLAFLIYLLIDKSKQNNLLIGSIIIAFVTIIYIFSSFIYSNFLVSQKESHKALKGFYKPIRYEQRLDYFIQAAEGFCRFPIYGTGLDTFRYVSNIFQKDPSPYSWSLYTHNHYLEIFQETGILGGLVFTILIILILYKSYKNIINIRNSYANGIFVAVIGSSFHSLMDYDWQFLSVFLFFWIGVAIILPRNQKLSLTLPKYIRVSFLLIITILFGSSILLPLNSDKINIRAIRYSQSGQKSKAIYFLTRAYKLDKMNRDIAEAMAEIYKMNYNDWETSHLWYKKAILLGSMRSARIIKDDYLLYLRQADLILEENDPLRSYSYLRTSAVFYPFDHKKIEGDKYFASIDAFLSKNNNPEASIIIRSYLKLIQEEAEKSNLSQQEIKMVIKNICVKSFIDNQDKFAMLNICQGK